MELNLLCNGEIMKTHSFTRPFANITLKKRVYVAILAVFAIALQSVTFESSWAVTDTVTCSGGGSYDVVDGEVRNGGTCIGAINLSAGTQVVTSISQGAFDGSGITSINIPNTVTRIGASAFQDCELTTVTFSSNSQLTYIGDKAFVGNNIGLVALDIPGSVEEIGIDAFTSNLLYSGGLTINVNITASMNEHKYWFFDCLEADCVDEAGSFDFTDSSNQPAGLTWRLADHGGGYGNRNYLGGIPTAPLTARKSYGDANVLINWNITTSVPTVTFNPNGGVGTMTDQPIINPTWLDSNTFTKSNYGFEGWATSNSGEVVYQDAQQYTFASSVTLYAVWKPIVVTFDSGGGSHVDSLTFSGTVLDQPTDPTPPHPGWLFRGWVNPIQDEIIWPWRPSNAVTLSAWWGVPCGDGVYYDLINGLAFGGGACTGYSITNELILDSSVTEIGRLLTSTSTVKKLIVPNSVTFLGYRAFEDASALKEITFALGSTLDVIDTRAFKGAGLLAITIPASVTQIRGQAFENATSLHTLNFESGSHLTSIGDFAFSNTLLNSVTFPASLTTIEHEAFAGTASLQSIVFPNDSNLTSIGFEAFVGTKLTSVHIPNRVTRIEEGTFMNCDLLETVVIGSGVTEIVDNAFWGAILLRSVVIPKKVTKIGTNVFPKELLAQNDGLTLHLAVGDSYEYKFITCQFGSTEFCDMKNSSAFRGSAPIGMSWSPDAGGETYNIVSGAPTTFGSSISALNTSYFLNWVVDAPFYSVTFDANGGSGTMNIETGTATAALSANTFARTGYTFSGWATSTGGAVVYADRADYAFTSDLNLYAKWTANAPAPSAPVAIPDPLQTSKVISAASEFNENSNGEEIIVLGDFNSPISNIAINGKVISSADWKQDAAKLVIKYVTNSSSKLSIQIWNGQAPQLSAIDVVINVKKVEPVAKPTEAPVATPVITPTPKPIAETGVKKAVVKKKTLVCYKGKKSKKVKAVKPVCPKGYKAKK